ncbi:MAG: LPS export ABC transporter periplasmic protein LptC [Armatimonadota bacterium]|nr:LPS export ABC transporter periplasmic protein LptC [Armatimonadota bacterium]MDR5697520.1 LPS export ABC transporter periplasmic protein LptC [Armatimonadota bacterium]
MRAHCVLLTVALVFLTAAACAGPGAPAQTPPPPAAASPTPVPFLEMSGSRLVGTDAQGRKVWELQAEGVVVDDAQQNVTLQRLSGYFFAEDGLAVRFEAARASYSVPDRVIRLEGAVRTVAADDRWFAADRVIYVAADNRVVASGNVRFRYGTMTVQGSELRADVALRRARLTGAVRATVREGERP